MEFRNESSSLNWGFRKILQSKGRLRRPKGYGTTNFWCKLQAAVRVEASVVAIHSLIGVFSLLCLSVRLPIAVSALRCVRLPLIHQSQLSLNLVSADTTMKAEAGKPDSAANSSEVSEKLEVAPDSNLTQVGGGYISDIDKHRSTWCVTPCPRRVQAFVGVRGEWLNDISKSTRVSGGLPTEMQLGLLSPLYLNKLFERMGTTNIKLGQVPKLIFFAGGATPMHLAADIWRSYWTFVGVLAHMESNKEQEENSNKSKSVEAVIKKDLPEAQAIEAKAIGQDTFTESISRWPLTHTSVALRLLQRFDEAANAFYEGVKERDH
ncbi:hypothetical protein Bca4012_054853 [Brassica carinata]